MSQLYPDIPELEGVPEVLRSNIWMQAYTRALGRGKTWVLGLMGLAMCVGGCGVTGHRVAGTIGAIMGALAGSGFGLMLFVRIIIEWQARRLVPEVRAAAGWALGSGRDNTGTA